MSDKKSQTISYLKDHNVTKKLEGAMNLLVQAKPADPFGFLAKELNKMAPPPKPEVIFVLGGPGSGKGTQCANIVRDYGYVHLSAGDLLREERSKNTDTSAMIEQYIKDGKIVPVEITVGLIKKAMEKAVSKGTNVFLVDGFPRNQDNLEGWYKVMGDYADVRFVLFFECPETVMEARLMERGKTSGRSDDNIESIRKRFRTYLDETMPVVSQFEKAGKLRRIDATAPVSVVYNDVKVALRPLRPQVVFVLGGPGAGKGTQCERIVKNYGFVHLSAGDLLREERTRGNETGQLIDTYIKEGKIVPVEITVRLLKKAMEDSVARGKANFLIDGFPRNQNNLEGWIQVMGEYADVKFVLMFDCSEQVMEARLLERGKTSGRTDDNIETIRKRFRTYVEETMPVIQHFEKLGKVRKVNAEKEVDAVYQETAQYFEQFIAPIQTTYAFIKPDAVKSGYEKSVLQAIRDEGFEIVEQRRLLLPTDLAQTFYMEHRGRPFFEGLVKFMTSGPVVALGLRKQNAVKAWREALGPTNVDVARQTHPWSIRARFGASAGENACHGSDSLESANRELELLFPGSLHKNHIGKRIIISGPPAAGKGTQCEYIKAKYGVVHISTGDILRAAIKEKSTLISKEVEETMKSGGLAPDETVIALVKARLEKQDCVARGWLLDGFPRTPAQAKALTDLGIKAHKFILLEVPDAVIADRVTGRRMDPVTQSIYHVKFNPAPADVADRLIQRADDTEEAIKTRLQNYHANIDSVRNFYNEILVAVDGGSAKEQVFEQVLKSLEAH